MKIFSDGEMKRRYDGLKAIMDRLGLDAVVTTSLHSNVYFSNLFIVRWGRDYSVVIPAKGEPILICPLMEYHRALAHSWVKDVRYYADSASAFSGVVDGVREALSEAGCAAGRVGIEEDSITAAISRALQDGLPRCTFVDASEPMMRQRRIKSREEIEITRHCAAIADVGGQAFMEAIAEGRTEVEIAMAATDAMEMEYVRRFPEDWECYGNWTYCQSGPRTMFPHGINTTRKVRRGELIILNCGPNIMGYMGTLEKTIMFGPMTDKIRRPFEVAAEAHEAGIEAVKPGVRCGDVDRTTNSVLEKAGLLEYKTFGSGHSYGLMGPFWGREEGGELRTYNDTVLQEGMIVSMEPSVYVPDVGGFRQNDMLLVTKDGNEVLTKFRRGVIVVE
ncbi:MAG: Xaa-Pro peptidase family protein [Dehalococcoidia bacterium]